MKLRQVLNENVIITGADPSYKSYYQQVVQYLTDVLSIDSTVMVHFGMKGLFKQGHTGSTLPDPSRPHVIHIFIPPGLDRASLVRALCHEAVHAQQLDSKRLELDIQDGKLVGMAWEGTPVDEAKYNRNGPWELEAHTKEHQLLQDVIQTVGNLQI